MTMEEKKIGLIGKIINLENDKTIDMVNELLDGTNEETLLKKAGWGKGMVSYVSDDFNDFIPPGFVRRC